MSSSSIVPANRKIWILTTVAIGIVSIFVIFLLGLYLSSTLGPFTSSILVEISTTVIIIGGSWGVHTKLIRGN
jgi:hypothetical protein